MVRIMAATSVAPLLAAPADLVGAGGLNCRFLTQADVDLVLSFLLSRKVLLMFLCLLGKRVTVRRLPRPALERPSSLP